MAWNWRATTRVVLVAAAVAMITSGLVAEGWPTMTRVLVVAAATAASAVLAARTTPDLSGPTPPAAPVPPAGARASAAPAALTGDRIPAAHPQRSTFPTLGKLTPKERVPQNEQ